MIILLRSRNGTMLEPFDKLRTLPALERASGPGSERSKSNGLRRNYSSRSRIFLRSTSRFIANAKKNKYGAYPSTQLFGLQHKFLLKGEIKNKIVKVLDAYIMIVRINPRVS